MDSVKTNKSSSNYCYNKPIQADESQASKKILKKRIERQKAVKLQLAKKNSLLAASVISSATSVTKQKPNDDAQIPPKSTGPVIGQAQGAASGVSNKFEFKNGSDPTKNVKSKSFFAEAVGRTASSNGLKAALRLGVSATTLAATRAAATYALQKTGVSNSDASAIVSTVVTATLVTKRFAPNSFQTLPSPIKHLDNLMKSVSQDSVSFLMSLGVLVGLSSLSSVGATSLPAEISSALDNVNKEYHQNKDEFVALAREAGYSEAKHGSLEQWAGQRNSMELLRQVVGLQNESERLEGPEGKKSIARPPLEIGFDVFRGEKKPPTSNPNPGWWLSNEDRVRLTINAIPVEVSPGKFSRTINVHLQSGIGWKNFGKAENTPEMRVGFSFNAAAPSAVHRIEVPLLQKSILDPTPTGEFGDVIFRSSLGVGAGIVASPRNILNLIHNYASDVKSLTSAVSNLDPSLFETTSSKYDALQKEITNDISSRRLARGTLAALQERLGIAPMVTEDPRSSLPTGPVDCENPITMKELVAHEKWRPKVNASYTLIPAEIRGEAKLAFNVPERILYSVKESEGTLEQKAKRLDDSIDGLRNAKLDQLMKEITADIDARRTERRLALSQLLESQSFLETQGVQASSEAFTNLRLDLPTQPISNDNPISAEEILAHEKWQPILRPDLPPIMSELQDTYAQAEETLSESTAEYPAAAVELLTGLTDWVISDAFSTEGDLQITSESLAEVVRELTASDSHDSEVASALYRFVGDMLQQLDDRPAPSTVHDPVPDNLNVAKIDTDKIVEELHDLAKQRANEGSVPVPTSSPTLLAEISAPEKQALSILGGGAGDSKLPKTFNSLMEETKGLSPNNQRWSSLVKNEGIAGGRGFLTVMDGLAALEKYVSYVPVVGGTVSTTLNISAMLRDGSIGQKALAILSPVVSLGSGHLAAAVTAKMSERLNIEDKVPHGPDNQLERPDRQGMKAPGLIRSAAVSTLKLAPADKTESLQMFLKRLAYNLTSNAATMAISLSNSGKHYSSVTASVAGVHNAIGLDGWMPTPTITPDANGVLARDGRLEPGNYETHSESDLGHVGSGRSSKPDRVIDPKKSPLEQQKEKSDLQSDGLQRPIEIQSRKQGRIRWVKTPMISKAKVLHKGEQSGLVEPFDFAPDP